MWQTTRHTNRLDDGSRYDVELARSGQWIAYYVQTAGRKPVPIKQVDATGNERDFGTEFEAMMACEVHRRGLDGDMAVAS